MLAIYLNYAVAKRFMPLKPQIPRTRFVDYYRDLYHLEKRTIDAVTLTQGDAASFVDLGKNVLDTCYVDGLLNHSDMLICATWAHEFDPDHSSSGPYFSDRYEIPYVFDVCDQGSITPFLSLKILFGYMQSGHYQKALLLGLEQTCIPRCLKDNAVMPSMAGSGVMIFSHTPNPHTSFNLQLISAEIIREEAVLHHGFNVHALLQSHCTLLHIALKEVAFVVKKSSTLWKRHQMTGYQEKNFALHPAIGSFDNAIGMLPFFSYWQTVLGLEPSNTRYIALLDEDVESLSIGLVIFEVLPHVHNTP